MDDDDSNGRDGPNNPEKHNLTGKNTPKTKDDKNTQDDHTDPTQTLVTTDPTQDTQTRKLLQHCEREVL